MNLKVRLKNKVFWLAFIPTFLLLVQQIAKLVGVDLDFTALSDELKVIVETVFLLLGILGIVVDPTTEGVGDSERAMTYTEPYQD